MKLAAVLIINTAANFMINAGGPAAVTDGA
jgi:hypothetical protein